MRTIAAKQANIRVENFLRRAEQFEAPDNEGDDHRNRGNLIAGELGLTDGGGFWGAIGAINDNFGILGYVIIGVFLVAWIGSVVFYKIMRYDELEIQVR